jgi:SAM-dependent methyltransferase
MPDDPTQSWLTPLYANRFPKDLHERRRQIWRTLYDEWLNRYVAPGARVLEIAPGYCEFINCVGSDHERVGVDLNADSARFAEPGITIHQVPAEKMGDVLPADHFDVVFTSNFFEHCRTRDALIEVLRATRQVLRPGGKLLVLGPNLKHCQSTYFDYFDHHLPLTDQSMAEALTMTGFVVDEQIAQTLPFTMRGKLPTAPWLVSLYLKLPLAWKVFGAQFFIVARKP